LGKSRSLRTPRLGVVGGVKLQKPFLEIMKLAGLEKVENFAEIASNRSPVTQGVLILNGSLQPNCLSDNRRDGLFTRGGQLT